MIRKKAGDTSSSEASDAKAQSSMPPEGKAEPENVQTGDKPKADGEGNPSAVADKDASEKPNDAKDDKSPEKKDVLDLQGLKLNDTALTASFNGEDWGFEGIIRLSLTLTESDATVKDRAAGIGSIVWPDGSTSITTAVRIDPPASADAQSEEPSNESKPRE